MNVKFSVVPPGGGETDYEFENEMEALPNAGDYVFKGDSEGGKEQLWAAFIVRRRWFWPGENNILIEVEPARYALQSESHKKVCDMYAARGKPLQEIQNSCY